MIEEPIFDSDIPSLEIQRAKEQIWIITPHLPSGTSPQESLAHQKQLLAEWHRNFGIQKFFAWFYTPLALPLLEALPTPVTIIYDCMDELAAFKGASQNTREQEILLLEKASLVFTGGQSLFEAKKDLHHNIHPFASSIDKQHFMKARYCKNEPEDQQRILHPRIGFFGVVDERFDIELLGELAKQRTDWEFIIIGPVVKIDPETLPRASNIHYLGGKSYEQLPEYLSGWDVALIPFAINESTQFISPTKTPEYLAGGIPVVSSRIKDVVEPYGDMGLVYIADTASEFVEGIEWAMQRRYDFDWLKQVDIFLAGLSWDITWARMAALIKEEITANQNGNLITNHTEHV